MRASDFSIYLYGFRTCYSIDPDYYWIPRGYMVENYYK